MIERKINLISSFKKSPNVYYDDTLVVVCVCVFATSF